MTAYENNFRVQDIIETRNHQMQDEEGDEDILFTNF